MKLFTKLLIVSLVIHGMFLNNLLAGNEDEVKKAVARNDEQGVLLAIENGVMPNQHSGPALTTPLIHAVIFDQVNMVKILLKHLSKEDIDSKVYGGWTAIHYAAVENRIEIAQLLIDHGAFIDTTNNNKETPLHLAKSVNMLDLLIKNKANIEAKNLYGYTALNSAAFFNNEELLKFLVSQNGYINSLNYFGNTPILSAQYALDSGLNRDANVTHNIQRFLEEKGGKWDRGPSLVVAEIKYEHEANLKNTQNLLLSLLDDAISDFN